MTSASEAAAGRSRPAAIAVVPLLAVLLGLQPVTTVLYVPSLVSVV